MDKESTKMEAYTDSDPAHLCQKHQEPFWVGTEICPVCRAKVLDETTTGLTEEWKEYWKTHLY